MVTKDHSRFCKTLVFTAGFVTLLDGYLTFFCHGIHRKQYRFDPFEQLRIGKIGCAPPGRLRQDAVLLRVLGQVINGCF